jgi:hypothetical protein
VISISPSQAPQLIQALTEDFYISESAVIEAINQRRSFNIIHYTNI